MTRYPGLASRIFGVPLLISRAKLDAIMVAIAPRLGVDASEGAPDAQAYGPGDKTEKRKSYYVTEDGIGVISVIGPLVKRDSGEFISGGPTTYGEIENEFMDAATDPNIKGILLQIDSPGGESVGAFELADLIYSQRGSKPIVAAADGDAFSAAYALASAAERLYVTKSGGVGSVGVWMMHIDQSGYNAQKGVKPTYLFAGARKIDGNPHEALTDEARSVFQSEVDRIYGMFVDTVARNRGMKQAAVRKTEAGLFFGEAGVSVGFADQVGTISDALASLRQRIAASSSVAKLSATNSEKGKGTTKMENEEVADTQKPPEPEVTAPSGGDAAQFHFTGEELAVNDAAVRASGADHAKQIVQLCALAGLTARQALTFLKPEASIDAVRQEILEARAANGGDEINSHISPDAGAMGDKGDREAVINKVAERFEAAAKGGK
jgi:capsid assembly protease